MTDRPTLRQPWISDLSIAVRGNVTTLGERSGDIDSGATGFYADDRRLISLLRVTMRGDALIPIAASGGGETTKSMSVARHLGDQGPDPTVTVHRHRTIVSGGVDEEITIESRAADVVTSELQLEIASDGADMHDVKGGLTNGRRRIPHTCGVASVGWRDDRHEVTVTMDPPPARLTAEGGLVVASWPVAVPPGGRFPIRLECRTARRAASDFDAGPGADVLRLREVVATATDDRISRLTATSTADLEGLLLSDPLDPRDCFAGAGTPWYLTLFGRDSIWAARLALPFGTDLAAGTLRALARRQGATAVLESAQEPGKILHETRRTVFDDPASPMRLPSVYYGTVDATPLWVTLLHEAWTWGMNEDVVGELTPHLIAAMGWLEHAERAGGGLLTYHDGTGTGLSNQGWKDSGDSMRRRDGSIAPAPIALIETMAYGAAAATGAVRLATAIGLDAGEELLERWSGLGERLSATIRERFWACDDLGDYLAMAIAGDGTLVDGVGSNMGHVLGTGVLTSAEARSIADRLMHPSLLREFGIATLSSDNPGYNPIGYHTGSVWVHDTAIAALGLAREGLTAQSAEVLRRIIDLGSRVDYRLPELLSGETVLGAPVPYPASCRPQAWAAAAGAAVAPMLLGLTPNAPQSTVAVAPLAPLLVGAIEVDGIHLGPHRLAISVDSGGIVHTSAPDAITVITR